MGFCLCWHIFLPRLRGVFSCVNPKSTRRLGFWQGKCPCPHRDSTITFCLIHYYVFFLRHGGPPPKALHQSALTTGRAFMASRSLPKTEAIGHKIPYPGC